MPAFFDYFRNITYYLLFAALVGLIAPTGKYKKYVSLVMGFILLLLLLQPIRNFMGTQIPVTEWFAGLLYQETHDTADFEGTYSAWRDNSLAAAFEAQLAAQTENLLKNNNISMHEASFTYTADFSRITSVHVLVSRNDAEETRQRVPFIRIEPVQIRREDPTENIIEDPLVNEVKNLIAGFYNLPGTHIYVEVKEL